MRRIRSRGAVFYAGLCLTPGIPRALAHAMGEKLAEHAIYAAVALLAMLPAVFGRDDSFPPRSRAQP